MIVAAISTSDFISSIQEEVLRIGQEKHFVTGYPRNDLLFKHATEKKIAEIKGDFSRVFCMDRHGDMGKNLCFFRSMILNL